MDKKEYQQQYQKEHTAWFKQHGICVKCRKNKVEEGSSQCEECKKKQRERIQNLRKQRKENHECTSCGMKLDDDYFYTECETCREKKAKRNHKKWLNTKSNIDLLELHRKKSNEWKRKDYQDKKEKGLCIVCGKCKPMNGWATCPNCLEKKAQSTKAHPKTEKQKLAHNKQERELRQYRIANGYCAECGRRLTDFTYKSCIECRIKARKKSKKQMESKRIRGMECGTCLICGKPRVEGFYYCEEHYEKQKQLALNMVNTRKSKGNFMFKENV